MKINITQEVIDRSKAKVKEWEKDLQKAQENPYYFPKIDYCSICVIAEAFKDLGFKNVEVTDKIVADDRSFLRSEKAMNIMERFDEGEEVKPTVLRLKEIK